MEEVDEESVTYNRLQARQRKSLRTTDAFEPLQEELRRRVKTQASWPLEEAAVLVFIAFSASGQVKMRRFEV